MWYKIKKWFHIHEWNTYSREILGDYGYVDRQVCRTCGEKRVVF